MDLPREVDGQYLGCLLDSLDDSLGELCGAEMAEHRLGYFSPEALAAFLVDALVADDGEGLTSRGNEEQYPVEAGHLFDAQAMKLLLHAPRGRRRLGDKDTDFAARAQLRPPRWLGRWRHDPADGQTLWSAYLPRLITSVRRPRPRQSRLRRRRSRLPLHHQSRRTLPLQPST